MSASPRRRLPNRRRSEVLDLIFRQHRYSVGVSRFEDGRLAEIFIQPAKGSSALEEAARDIAVLMSIALQHGSPVDVLQGALTRLADGEPAGIAGAILDAVAAMEASP